MKRCIADRTWVIEKVNNPCNKITIFSSNVLVNKSYKKKIAVKLASYESYPTFVLCKRIN